MFNNATAIIKANKDKIVHRALIVGGATAGMVVASGISSTILDRRPTINVVVDSESDIVVEETIEETEPEVITEV